MRKALFVMVILAMVLFCVSMALAEMKTVICIGFDSFGESTPCIDYRRYQLGDYSETTALNVFLSEGWKILQMEPIGHDNKKIVLQK